MSSDGVWGVHGPGPNRVPNTGGWGDPRHQGKHRPKHGGQHHQRQIRPAIELKPVDPKGAGLRCKLGVGFIIPTVAGGWSPTQRARRKSLTEYVGSDPDSQDIPILFDGHSNETSVEPEIKRLYSIMTSKVGPRNEPAVIEVHGFPIPFQNNRWVLNSITPGDEIRRQHDGQRVQAQFTITLLEYVAGDVIVAGSPAKKHQGKNNNGGGKGNKATQYTTKKGDTLKKIAVHFYGKAKDWHVIADANNLRDPHHLKVGTKLKIPAHGQ